MRCARKIASLLPRPEAFDDPFATVFIGYEEDFFTWTQDQSAALRRLSEGEDIDVENLAEEIADLGKRDLREVTSLLTLLFGHLMTIAANPESQSAAHRIVERGRSGDRRRRRSRPA